MAKTAMPLATLAYIRKLLSVRFSACLGPLRIACPNTSWTCRGSRFLNDGRQAARKVCTMHHGRFAAVPPNGWGEPLALVGSETGRISQERIGNRLMRYRHSVESNLGGSYN